MSQIVLMLLASASVLAVLLASGRSLRCAYRTLRTRRFAVTLGVFAALAGLLGLLAFAGIAWFARAVAHGSKSGAGDIALAAVTLLPLLGCCYAVWRMAARIEGELALPGNR